MAWRVHADRHSHSVEILLIQVHIRYPERGASELHHWTWDGAGPPFQQQTVAATVLLCLLWGQIGPDKNKIDFSVIPVTLPLCCWLYYDASKTVKLILKKVEGGRLRQLACHYSMRLRRDQDRLGIRPCILAQSEPTVCVLMTEKGLMLFK